MFAFSFLHAVEQPQQVSIAIIANSSNDKALANKVLARLQELESFGVNPIWMEPVSAELPEDILKRASNTEASIILTFGVQIAFSALNSKTEWQIPVVAGMVHDSSLFGINRDAMGRSGKNNVNFVDLGSRTSRDLTLFQQLTPFKEVTVLVWDQLLENPSLKEQLTKRCNILGIKAHLLGVGDAPLNLNAIKGPVYLGPLRHLEGTNRINLLETLVKQKIPVYAMLGHEDLERGAFAGALTEAEKRLTQRLAEHVEAIIGGDAAHNLPTWLAMGERLAINGKTALALGVEPQLELRLIADILHEDALERGRKLSLRNAVEAALSDNANLAARREETRSIKYERRMTDANLLPQLSAGASYERNDPTNSRVEAGFSPETLEQASLQAEQVIFNDAHFTNSRIARKNLVLSESQLKSSELDTVHAVANAYLGLLSNQALLDIEIENLKLTRENLRTARIRLQLGSGGNEEVYRWESQEAQQLGSVYGARAEVTSARASLTGLLGLDPTVEWFIEPHQLTPADTLFLDPRWNRLLEKPGNDLQNHLMTLARAESPDIEAARNRELIAKMRVGSAKRSFFLPSVSLQASYQDVLDQEFLTGTTPLFPVNNSATWSLKLNAGIPLFNGGRRVHELGRLRAQERQATYLETSAKETVNETLIKSLAAARASLPTIELTRRAADRAARNLGIVLNKYEQGKASILELLEARDQDLTQSRQSALAGYSHLANLFLLQRTLAYYDLLLPVSEREAWLTNLEVALDRKTEKVTREGEAL